MEHGTLNTLHKPYVSIIIPTYNEEDIIGKTIAHLQQYLPHQEIIVADGNSNDATRLIVSQQFPEVILLQLNEKGRALQMNSGAAKAKANILFFLHADTFPPVDALSKIQDVFNNEKIVAASFSLRFDSGGWPYRILSFLSRWNSTYATYGDQGLIIRKNIFEEVGGFRALPIFEDLEIQKRLRRAGRFVKISRAVVTSARRFQKQGLFRQLLLNIGLIFAWRMGMPAEKLTQFYTDKKKK